MIGSPSPRNPNAAYDVELFDGSKRIGLHVSGDMARNPVRASTLKTTSGNQSYSDMEPPYTAIAQDTFTGGRGALQYEKDVTRYRDGLRANTERDGGVILAGREQYAKAIRSGAWYLPGGMKMVDLLETKQYLGNKITPDDDIDVVKIGMWVKKVGTPNDLTMAIYSHNVGGRPFASLATGTISADDVDDVISEFVLVEIGTESLTGSTSYWAVVYGDDDDDAENHWQVGVKNESGTTLKNRTGYYLNWSSVDVDLYFQFQEEAETVKSFWFEYKKGWYVLTQPVSGGAPQLFLNGARGLATNNAGDKGKLITSTAHGVSEEDAIGGVLYVIAGSGSSDDKNWRIVTGVSDTDEFEVDEEWGTTHTVTTEWVLLAPGLMSEIDVSSDLTKRITDVLVATNEHVYFCQENDVIVRMMEENDTSVWTRTFTDEAVKADFLAQYKNGANEKIVRVRLGNIYECTLPDNGDALATWTDAVTPGSQYDRIRGIQTYKDYDLDDAVAIFKESGAWFYKDEQVDEFRTPEMKNIMSADTGVVSNVHGSYLLFSVQHTLWRFYNPEFSDIGLQMDEGLPVHRQGPVSAIEPYPGKIYIAVDGGEDGYSGIFSSGVSSNYTEIYRAPKGERILGLGFQPTPGESLDRLWFTQGADVLWIPFPSATYDPYQVDNYPYTHEFSIELASITAGLYDAWKYWRSLKLRTEGLGADEQWIEVDYRTNDDEDWVPLNDVFVESPVQSQILKDLGVSCQVIYLRVRGYSASEYLTPKLLAVVLNGVTVTEPKFYYQFQAEILYEDPDGNATGIAPYKVVEVLDNWSGRAQPLKMLAKNPLFHDREVFLLPVAVRGKSSAPKVGEFDYVVTIGLQDA